MGRRDYLNTDYFKSLDTPEKVYWYGFIFGDGYMQQKNTWRRFDKTRYRIFSFTLHEKDVDHLVKFGSIFRHNPSILHIKNRPHVRFSISNSDICDSLYKLGIVPRKSLRKLSKIAKHIPIEYIRDFTRGLFDADGCAQTSFTISNGSFDVLRFIQHFLPVDGHFSSQKKIFKLSVYGRKNMLELYHWLYDDSWVYLKRKKDRLYYFATRDMSKLDDFTLSEIAYLLSKAMYKNLGARAFDLDVELQTSCE